jgi:cardiolipin synthase A/B
VRSFRLNDAAYLNVLDRAFAREQAAVFDADGARARCVTPSEWEARPFTERVQERLALLLRSQL